MQALSSLSCPLPYEPGTDHHRVFASICKEARKRRDKIDGRDSQGIADMQARVGGGGIFRSIIDDLVEVQAIQELHRGSWKVRKPLYFCTCSGIGPGEKASSSETLDTAAGGGVAHRAATGVIGACHSASAVELELEALVDGGSLPTAQITLGGPRLVRVAAQKAAPDSLVGLVRYFERELDQTAACLGSSVNYKAMMRHIAEWRRQGLEPDHIRTMVDIFVAHPDWWKGKPPWKVFVSRRNMLLEMLTKEQERQEHKARSHDRNYWLGIK